MAEKYDYYEHALSKRFEQNRYRQLRCIIPLDESHILYQEKKLVNFSSNDYLGLSQHPFVKKNTIKYVLHYGAGSTASRLVTGHLECHQMLENKLSQMLGTEKTLLFSSGFQANCTVLSTLANAKSLLFLDRNCHNSLVQGAMASRGRVIRFDHNNLSHLETLLEKHKSFPYSSKIIVSESVFSMDGDKADLNTLIELSKKHNALLYIDDAHAFGVLGVSGLGLAAKRNGIDLVVGTFGKACGSFGAFVACNELLKEYLINFCAGFIYTTALPPSILGAIDAALDLIPDMEKERKHIVSNSEFLRKAIQTEGFSTGASETHIIPIILGCEEEALKLSDFLREENFLVAVMRPPSVPLGGSRIRLAINVDHNKQQLTDLCSLLRAWKKEATLAAL